MKGLGTKFKLSRSPTTQSKNGDKQDLVSSQGPPPKKYLLHYSLRTNKQIVCKEVFLN